MATRHLLVAFSLVMSLMLVGCTTYYRITDPTTGKSYYATDFDRGRDGSITLTDENRVLKSSFRSFRAVAWKSI